MSKRFVDKYRPRKLAQLSGQRAAVSTIKGLLREGKILGNTVLLSGPYGTGKTTLARILAKAVNCEDAEKVDPCGKCASCRATIESHPDIKEFDAARTRGIDEVRNLISLSNLRPRYNGRVFIIDEIHQLTGPAAQAFLKALEEPPPHTAYILCTTDPYKILGTIRSRSTWIKLGEIRPSEMSKFLTKVATRENIEVTKEIISYLVELSGGHMRDALNLLEQVGASASEVSLEDLPAIAEGILGASPHTLLPKYVTKLLEGSISSMVYLRKVDSQEYFLNLVIPFLKEYIILKTEPKMVDNKSLVSFDKSARFKVPTTDKLIKVLELHLEALERISRRSISPLDALDLAVLKSIQVLND